MVETQSCVHIIYILQESEEVLHLLKCDALCEKMKNVFAKSVTDIRAFRGWEK